MALGKSKELPSGVQVAYHRIIGETVDYVYRVAIITVGAYLDEAARLDEKQPVYTMKYRFEGDDPELNWPIFPFTDIGVRREEGYAALKALPDFSEAVDV